MIIFLGPGNRPLFFVIFQKNIDKVHNVHYNIITRYTERTKKKGEQDMKLYKNVDIADLKKIMEKGLLSLNESGNNNWNNDNRDNNSKDVVYLFVPTTESNSFVNYGAALLEIEMSEDEVKKNEMNEYDYNFGKYDEYVAERVPVEKIVKVYVPEIFKKRLVEFYEVSEDILEMITWCGMEADIFVDKIEGVNVYEKASEDTMERFASTARIFSTEEYNFFRGKDEKREMIDLKNVKYVF